MRAQHPPGRSVLALGVGFLQPVVHRHDHERRAAGGGRLVVRAVDRARNVLRPDGLVDPDRVVAGEAAQASGQERLEDEVPPVLLADDDTSGARLTRAVAMPPTELPRPAVVWTSTSAGSPRPIA